jgi:hypothetical protein
MQNRSNFPQNQSPNQSPVKNTNDKAPMQNSNNAADGKTPHQPTESRES